MRRPREGVEKLRHGIRISPLDSRLSYWGSILANTLFRLREFEEARKEAEIACGRDDRFANPRVVLAMILTQLGQADEASRAMEEAKRLFPDLTASHVVGLIGRRGVKILRDASLLDQ